jgi:DNA-binding NarL/FixJ family response regulator
VPEEPKRIRVQILTESAHTRARLRAIIAAAPGLELSEESTGGDAAADVVLLDPEPLADSLSRGPPPAPASARTLILTDRLSEEWARELLSRRAAGAIARSAQAKEIIAAIESVTAGLIVFSAGLLADAQPQPGPARKPPPGALQDSLTPRETDVLRMLADGVSNKEVALRLHISEHTVKYHLSSIFGKLGVSSRTEAVMAGIQRGIILI